MRKQQRFQRFVAFTAVVLLTSLVQGTEVVKVRLQNGRVLTGEVDPRTNADALWLRFRYSSLSLSSSFAWSRIESVQVAQRRMSPDEFRQIADDLKASEAHQVEANDFPGNQNLIVLRKRGRKPNEAARVASLWATTRLRWQVS